MDILKNIKVPTGNILVIKGENGKLEALSIGDYGKHINLKCDVLGLTSEPNKVRHTKLLPLEEKWVITISTQYGCSMGCTFCDVPMVGKGKNATTKDLIGQVLSVIKLHPEVESTKRLNIHYARMGEPTYNPDVLAATRWFKIHIDSKYKIHPVVSTMMPKYNKILKSFITDWMNIKNELLGGEAGLQLSINSTDEYERRLMFNGNAHTLESISEIIRGIIPKGRKITLNFAVSNYKIDPDILLKYFNPDHFIIKLTPMHKTQTALNNSIETKGDYTTYHPYRIYEEKLKKAGYDVLVFIASVEEDLGMITCGNAILSGNMPKINYTEVLDGNLSVRM